MKQFINLINGNIEIPHNKEVIKQYEKRTDLYAEYKPKEKKKNDKNKSSNTKK